MYQLLADAVLVLHLAFIVFVLCGGLLALRWPKAAWVHLPAAAWGALIELTGWICPLTPLENHFLELAGSATYQSDFIARYLWPIIYPEGLAPAIQKILGGLVIVLNGIVYAVVISRKKRRPAG
ncbi:MAG: DUF2784 domain-containing protein [Gallionellaceae bacterium]|nr:DUF2784 domain-containing protein [Gallionellaceae bacterium]